MKAWEFFDDVYNGELEKIDIYNIIQNMTDNFDELKLNLLCDDFDFYFFVKAEERRSQINSEEITEKINQLEREGKEIPTFGNRKKSHYKSVNSFFKRDKNKTIAKMIDKVHTKQSELTPLLQSIKNDQFKSVDIERLLYPYHFYSLYQLRNLLVNLKIKHTDAVYKFDDKKPQVNNIQPIHWLKGEESLKLFLQAIKKAGLIDSRETHEIIQEHIKVDDLEPTKKPQPINWLKSKVLLAYLIQELSTKPNMHEPFIEPDKKWQLTELHFTVKGKEIGRSLVNDIKQSRFPNGCEGIDNILKRLTKH